MILVPAIAESVQILYFWRQKNNIGETSKKCKLMTLCLYGSVFDLGFKLYIMFVFNSCNFMRAAIVRYTYPLTIKAYALLFLNMFALG